MLRAEQIFKKYKRRTVVNGVSVEVKQGEIVGLLGPNGAGKTTCFYMIVGLIKPNNGKIFVDDVEITDMPMYKRAQKGIGYLPQEASVFRKLTVEDNIRAILEMTGKPKKYQEERLETLLNEFSLQHVRTNRGDVLSGGERRRTEIARALANKPSPRVHCNMATSIYQVAYLRQTSSRATYFAAMDAVPAIIRPRPSTILTHENARCWDRPWQVRRFDAK